MPQTGPPQPWIVAVPTLTLLLLALAQRPSPRRRPKRLSCRRTGFVAAIAGETPPVEADIEHLRAMRQPARRDEIDATRAMAAAVAA